MCVPVCKYVSVHARNIHPCKDDCRDRRQRHSRKPAKVLTTALSIMYFGLQLHLDRHYYIRSEA